ncbi:hypothetical protein RhiirA4_466425 [Rhizophagus irregularis]|uniref:Uncharacterized protein n=1 Tax=Rhizophagus irregularis TaxID=588596 RepID=A0A2I1GU05_9GLOM|nr:hypothetical protein RhiirA4_466425 [Rhizophagus irregularis]
MALGVRLEYGLWVREGFIEDSYDTQQITLQSIIDEIGKEDVKEIWKFCDILPDKKLICIILDIICRHYFHVMIFSKIAGFHISMISERWYQDVYQEKPLM